MMEVTGGMNCSSCSYPASVRISVWSSSLDGCFQRLVPVLAVITGRRVGFGRGIKLEGGGQNFLNNKERFKYRQTHLMVLYTLL